MISAEEWDTRWWRIYNDAMADGDDSYDCERIADREMAEQFGDRPQDTNDAKEA